MNIEYLLKAIISPIITEKSSIKNKKNNQVFFKIFKNSTKKQIKVSVELLFKVRVKSVKTITIKGKIKRFGKFFGKRKTERKAYVSLKKGYEINFLEKK